jgi:hypothetical protein
VPGELLARRLNHRQLKKRLRQVRFCLCITTQTGEMHRFQAASDAAAASWLSTTPTHASPGGAGSAGVGGGGGGGSRSPVRDDGLTLASIAARPCNLACVDCGAMPPGYLPPTSTAEDAAAGAPMIVTPPTHTWVVINLGIFLCIEW